jgi:predicted helicase
MSETISVYNEEIGKLENGGLAAHKELNKTKIAWSSSLESTYKRRVRSTFSASRIVDAAYRPFSRQRVYFDSTFNHRVNQLPRIFPTSQHENLVICPTGRGATKDFSVLITDLIPDLEMISKAQCFSLYTYDALPEGEFPMLAEGETLVEGYRRRDNVTDATLTSYCGFYKDLAISKEDIFYFVYGLLHHSTYREIYKADLMKMLPRIPKVTNFWGFSSAGRALAKLHINYETIAPHPLVETRKSEAPQDRDSQFDFYRVDKMSFLGRKDRSGVVYNSEITLTGIPETAYDYQVNGKSAIEWILDRYQVTTHKESQIINDPNDYSREVDDPRYVIDLLARIVTVSLETVRIVAALPPLDILDENL